MELVQGKLEANFFSDKVQNLQELAAKVKRLEESNEKAELFSSLPKNICGTFNR